MHSRFSDHKEIKPYRQVLRVSLPLVISMSSTMIMEFTDRVFLRIIRWMPLPPRCRPALLHFCLFLFF